MITIAIDCGASFVKFAIVDEGRIISSERISAPRLGDKNDIFHPTHIKTLCKLVKDKLAQLIDEINNEKICVAISNEMHGFLLTDEAYNPLTDYISWQYEFGKEARNLFLLDENKEDVLHTGMGVRNNLPAVNLWYVLNKTKLFLNQRVLFMTLGDYLVSQITGMAPCCHPTNAAATGLYDITAKTWNKSLINIAIGESRAKVIFPIISDNKLINVECKNHVLYVVPAIGDHQAALYGANISFGDISFNLGTGAQVSKIVSEPVFSDKWQVQPYFDNKYLVRIPHLPSGRALNVFFRFYKSVILSILSEVADETIWNNIANVSYVEDTLDVDLSFFENSASSCESGFIMGINEKNFDFHTLTASVLIKMAENFIHAADTIVDNTMVSKIVFTGGIASKFPLIEKIITSHYDDVYVQMVTEETFKGIYNYSRLIVDAR